MKILISDSEAIIEGWNGSKLHYVPKIVAQNRLFYNRTLDGYFCTFRVRRSRVPTQFLEL